MAFFNSNQIKNLQNVCIENETFDASLFSADLHYVIKDLRVIRDHQVSVIISLGREKECDLQELEAYLTSLLQIFEERKIKNTKIVLQFDEKAFKCENGVRYLRGDATLAELRKAENNLKKKHDVDIFYSEHIGRSDDVGKLIQHGLAWNLEQVEAANLCVKKVAEYIKKNDLSPLEAIAFISMFAHKNFSYNLDKRFDDTNLLGFEKNNSIVSAVNYGVIRCVGYEQFFSAVVGELFSYFEGRLTSRARLIINKHEPGGHAISQVYIDDEKYGLKGGDFFVDLRDELINFLKRPIHDEKGYNGESVVKTSDAQVAKTAEGLILDNEGNPRAKVNSETVDDLLIKHRYGVKLFSSFASWKKYGWMLLDDDIVDHTLDYHNIPKQEIKQAKRMPITSAVIDNDSFRVCLVEKGPREIAKTVLKAYNNIKQIKVPTIAELLEGRKATHADKGAEI